MVLRAVLTVRMAAGNLWRRIKGGEAGFVVEWFVLTKL